MTVAGPRGGERNILKSKLSSRRDVADLLQTLFVAELLHPSRCLWLVSPWVSDIQLLDNRAGDLESLEPDWSPHPVRLSQVLLRLARAGTLVVVAVRDNGDSDDLLHHLHHLFEEHGVGDLLRASAHHDLHHKGLAADDFSLAGSMNLTYNGVHIHDEKVRLTTHRAEVDQARLDLHALYPGTLERNTR